MTIEDNDLPSLFRAADRASLQAQRTYLWCISADLFLIVSSALAGALQINDPKNKAIAAIVSAILMAAGLVLTFYIRGRRYEQNWFDGRAVAESVKTRAWRFMVCSEPYLESQSEAEATRLFLDELKTVVKERGRFAALIGANLSLEPEITPRMSEVRKLPFAEKKELYLSERINNQRQWYARKAKASQKASGFWFGAVIVSQGLALVSAIYLVRNPEIAINLTGVFAAMAAAFVAWLQLKRHQELANSYGLAAQELNFIAEQAKHIETLETFSAFVADAENAISREHTMWVARRDQL